MARPNGEGKALGYTAKDSETLERSLTRLDELARAVESFDDATGQARELAGDCRALAGTCKDLLQRFFVTPPGMMDGET